VALQAGDDVVTGDDVAVGDEVAMGDVNAVALVRGDGVAVGRRETVALGRGVDGAVGGKVRVLVAAIVPRGVRVNRTEGRGVGAPRGVGVPTPEQPMSALLTLRMSCPMVTAPFLPPSARQDSIGATPNNTFVPSTSSLIETLRLALQSPKHCCASTSVALPI
jgi:hypothetical protein